MPPKYDTRAGKRARPDTPDPVEEESVVGPLESLALHKSLVPRKTYMEMLELCQDPIVVCVLLSVSTPFIRSGRFASNLDPFGFTGIRDREGWLVNFSIDETPISAQVRGDIRFVLAAESANASVYLKVADENIIFLPKFEVAGRFLVTSNASIGMQEATLEIHDKLTGMVSKILEAFLPFATAHQAKVLGSTGAKLLHVNRGLKTNGVVKPAWMAQLEANYEQWAADVNVPTTIVPNGPEAAKRFVATLQSISLANKGVEELIQEMGTVNIAQRAALLDLSGKVFLPLSEKVKFQPCSNDQGTRLDVKPLNMVPGESFVVLTDKAATGPQFGAFISSMPRVYYSSVSSPIFFAQSESRNATYVQKSVVTERAHVLQNLFQVLTTQDIGGVEGNGDESPDAPAMGDLEEVFTL